MKKSEFKTFESDCEMFTKQLDGDYQLPLVTLKGVDRQ